MANTRMCRWTERCQSAEYRHTRHKRAIIKRQLISTNRNIYPYINQIRTPGKLTKCITKNYKVDGLITNCNSTYNSNNNNLVSTQLVTRTVRGCVRHCPCQDPVATGLAPVVQTLDSAIHRINHYPADKC